VRPAPKLPPEQVPSDEPQQQNRERSDPEVHAGQLVEDRCIFILRQRSKRYAGDVGIIRSLPYKFSLAEHRVDTLTAGRTIILTEERRATCGDRSIFTPRGSSYGDSVWTESVLQLLLAPSASDVDSHVQNTVNYLTTRGMLPKGPWVARRIREQWGAQQALRIANNNKLLDKETRELLLQEAARTAGTLEDEYYLKAQNKEIIHFRVTTREEALRRRKAAEESVIWSPAGIYRH
jgi:hypothetical protein